MTDPLDAQFEDLTRLSDKWQQTAKTYERAASLFAFLAGAVFMLLVMEAIR